MQSNQALPTKPEIPNAGLISVDGELRLASAHVRRDCGELKAYLECGGVFSPEEVDAMLRAMGTIVQNGTNREKIAAMKVLQTQAAMAIKLGQQPTPAQHLHVHQHTDAPASEGDDTHDPTSPTLRLVDDLLKSNM